MQATATAESAPSTSTSPNASPSKCSQGNERPVSLFELSLAPLQTLQLLVSFYVSSAALLFSLFSCLLLSLFSSTLDQPVELRQVQVQTPLVAAHRSQSNRIATSSCAFAFGSAHQNSLTCAANAPTERRLLIPNSDYLHLQSLLVGSLNRALQLSHSRPRSRSHTFSYRQRNGNLNLNFAQNGAVRCPPIAHQRCGEYLPITCPPNFLLHRRLISSPY